MVFIYLVEKTSFEIPGFHEDGKRDPKFLGKQIFSIADVQKLHFAFLVHFFNNIVKKIMEPIA